MELKIVFEKPPGFDEWYEDKISTIVAKQIVGEAIRRYEARHPKESKKSQEVVSGAKNPT
jgi:hypothetical protein